MERRQTLNPKHHLKLRQDFDAVYTARQSISDSHVIVYMKDNTLGYSRIGLSVGKKCGSAVVRNRIKRCLREAFRLCRQDLPAGYDYVLVPRPGRNPTTAQYCLSVTTLSKQLRRRCRKS